MLQQNLFRVAFKIVTDWDRLNPQNKDYKVGV